MSIATELQNLNDNILSAYDAVETKGGTVPANKNTANLSDAIMSITGDCEDVPVYGINSTTGMFYTDMVAPLEKLLVSITPIQSGSGTPSPNNIRPISGHTEVVASRAGKNIFDQSWFDTDVGTTITYKTFDIPNGTYTMSTNLNRFGGVTCNVFIGAGATLTPSSANNGVSYEVPRTITVTDGKYTVGYRSKSGTSDTGHDPKDFNWQLEQGSTATEYEPYRSVSYEVDFGKNLFDKDKPLVSDKYISADGTIKDSTSYQYSDYYTPVQPDTEYIFSGTFSGSAYNTISFYDTAKNFIGRLVPASPNTGAQFTTPSDCYYIRFNMGKNADLSTVQLEKGSVATAYQPYVGTVYGGTLDLTTGILTVTYKTLQAEWRLPTTTDTKNRWVIGMSIPDAWTELRSKMWAATTDYYSACDRLEKKPEANAQEGEATFAIYGHANSVEWRVRIPNTYTAEEAKAIADATTLCYPCEPQTYQLTPQQINTLRGNNTVTVEGAGIIDMVYLSHVLPVEYQAVDYIENTSTSYIDTGYSMTSDVTEQTIQFFSKPSAASSLFGAERSGTYTGVLWTATGGVSSALFIGSTRNATTEAMQRGIWHTVTIKTTSDTSGSLITDGYEQTFTYSDGVLKGYPIWLFNNNNASTGQYAKNRIARFQVSDNGVKVRDLVACYRKSDDVAGMYDIVNNTFYTNAGTGDFSVGEDI